MKHAMMITTPIFYVNGAPHLGHASTLLVADALARWHRMEGRRVLLATGTDEHGSKVERAAQMSGVAPREFCDSVSASFLRLANALHSSHDVFIRTTEARHVEMVQNVWRQLRVNGFVKKGRYAGYYSQPDESFVPPSRVREESDGRKVSAESGHTLDWLEEDTYVFPLGQFRDRVREWISKPGSIMPPMRQKEALMFNVEEELSISRPRKRVAWGIQVPDEPDHTVYVWLDALFNYFTVGRDEDAWPVHTHIVGKDILRFHAVYWPAFLMGCSLDLPQRIVCHGHWLRDGKKMSKSLGNVLDPFELIATYGSDPVRYFILSEMNFDSDSNFMTDALQRKVTADLADTLGNMIKRCTAKSVNPAQVVPQQPSQLEDAANGVLLRAMNELPAVLEKTMPELSFREAIAACMDVVHEANKYFEISKPWTLKNDPVKLNRVLFTTLEAVRLVMVAMQPIIPTSATRFLDELGVKPENRTTKHIVPFSDNIVGNRLNGFETFYVMEKKKKHT